MKYFSAVMGCVLWLAAAAVDCIGYVLAVPGIEIATMVLIAIGSWCFVYALIPSKKVHIMFKR